MLVFNEETGEFEEDNYETPPVDDSGDLIPLNPDEPPTDVTLPYYPREADRMAEIQKTWGTPPDAKSKSFLDQISTLPSYIQNLFKDKFTKPGTDGEIDWGKIATAGAGAIGAYQAYQDAKNPPPPTGYQGGIPAYTAVQGRAAEPVAGSRPGAGHQYFTGVKFAPAAGLPAAQAAVDAQVTGLNALNTANAQQDATKQAARLPVKAAYGGIM